MNRFKGKKLYIDYTFWFVICVCMVFSSQFMLRRGFVGADDAFNQEYPLFAYIGRYLRDVIHGTVCQFDFKIGFGDDVIAALSWHGFGDCFQILSAIFPVNYSELGYAFTMLLKFYFCGISFLVFSKRYLGKNFTKVCGALLYAFSVYNFARGIEFWVFLNPSITFPLMIAGIDDICCENEKKISKKYVLGLAIQALSGFYFLYIEIILTILYFLFMYFVDIDIKCKKVRVHFERVVQSVLQGCLGVGLGAVILIPSLIGYFTSSRTNDNKVFSTVKELLFFDKQYYVTFVKGLVVPQPWESVATIPLLVLLGGIVAFSTNKINKRIKRFVLFLLLCYFSPIFCSFMNGMSYCSDRWYFAIHLFLVILAMVGVEQVVVLSWQLQIVFCCVSIGCIVANLALINEITKGTLIRAVILLSCTCLLLYIWNTAKREKLFVWVTVLLVGINGIFVFSHSKIGGEGFAWQMLPYGNALERMKKGIRNYEAEELFERYDIYNASLATAMVLNYYGTSEYFSTLNGNMYNFYDVLKISPGLRSASWILKGLDSREELLSVLSVKKYTDFKSNSSELTELVLDNEAYLPFGFTYDSWISQAEFEKLSVPEMLSVLVNSVVLEDNGMANYERSFRDENILLDTFTEWHNIKQNENGSVADRDAYIRVYLEQELDLEHVYVQLQDFILKDQGTKDFYVGNKNLQIRNKDDIYYLGNDSFWVYVTELKQKDGRPFFDISVPEGCNFSINDVYVYSHEIDEEAMKKRKEHYLDNLQIRNNSIEGEISLENDEWLFLSIPFSTGWNAYIDGSSAELYKANVGFMAIKIPKGKHNVMLEYSTPGLVVGGIISLISAGIWMCFGFMDYRKKRTNIA